MGRKQTETLEDKFEKTIEGQYLPTAEELIDFIIMADELPRGDKRTKAKEVFRKIANENLVQQPKRKRFSFNNVFEK